MASSIMRPDDAKLGQIAERQPELLNLLVAYFVMEWQQVSTGRPPHGRDSYGITQVIPNYVARWGIDRCVHYIRKCPTVRAPDGPGGISWEAVRLANEGDALRARPGE